MFCFKTFQYFLVFIVIDDFSFVFVFVFVWQQGVEYDRNYGNLRADGEKKVDEGVVGKLDLVRFLGIQRIKANLTKLKFSNKLDMRNCGFPSRFRINIKY